MENTKSDNLDALLEIINNVPHHIFWKDKALVFRGCNKAFARQFGYEDQTGIIGKTDHDFPWSDALRKKYQQDDLAIINTSKAKLNYEESQTQADGSIKTVLVSKVPYYNQNQEVTGILGIYTDITTQKNMQNDLRKAKVLAEASSKAKSEFIANISHDIRTPITGILGLAQSLKDSAENEERRDDAELLMNTTNELLNLLNEVVDIVRLESGYNKMKSELFSIKALAEHNFLLLNASAKNKKIDFTVTIDENVPNYVLGNRVYVDRILLNLLSNAIKFTHEGHVKLSITTQPTENNIAHITFTVEDTGIGIPESQYEKIFENFFRLTPSYQNIYKGSGLGLFTVKQYLNALDGKVKVVSKEGKGSTFIVTIPLKPSQKMPFATNRPEKTTHGKETDRFGVQNALACVLVVEDNPLAARMARQLLQKCLCASEVASTAQEALRMMAEKSYDLILMDIGLPDMSGLEAAQQIKQCLKQSAPPIVVLTGHLSDDEKNKYLEAGIQEALLKPMTLTTTQKILKQFVFPNKSTKKNDYVMVDEIAQLETLDLDEGARLAGNNMTAAKEVMEMLIEALPADLEKLKSLHASHDIESMYQLVHKIYGGLCYCGVPRLRELTKRLKISLIENDLLTLDKQLEALLYEADNVMRESKAS